MRKIVFAGLDTLASGIRINSERTKVTELTAKTSEETITYRNGDIVSPAGLKSISLTYCFVLHDTSREAVAAKARQIAQTFSSVKGDLLDSDMPGKKYTNAVYVKSDPLEYVSRNFVTAYMMVYFKADPIPQESNTVNERVLKLVAVGNVTLNITNNSSYTITAGGSTSDSVSFTVTEPYKYRLVCYAENPEIITLNGAAITVGEVFTMPASAEIIIEATGYKYIELWHDTRTGVRL